MLRFVTYQDRTAYPNTMSTFFIIVTSLFITRENKDGN